MRLALSAFIVTIFTVPPARAQAPRVSQSFVSWTAELRTSSPLPAAAIRDSVVHRQIPKTYWLEGGLIVGVVVGALGSQICQIGEGHSSLCPVELFLVTGGFIGFPIGALIGGQFKKHPAKPADPPPQ